MSREPVSELSNKELEEKYKSYYERVEHHYSVGSKDLRYFSDLQKEVNERGGKIRELVEVEIPPRDVVQEGPVIYEDKGIAVRLTYRPEQDVYRVEYSLLLKSGELEGDWNLFGGSKGYSSSEYDTEEEAREFYNQLEDIPGDEILDHFAVEGENP